ncbi:MAG: FtsX-like permease family protein, partial [Propionibacteriales bacterium]|nr:FtsX-like permease family protein [Propionibacteriales bacterium]
MLRAAWKNLFARKLRLVMSGFAIVLGVAFVAGSFIFSDTLNKAFDAIFAGSVGDVVIRPEGSKGDETPSTLTIPASVVDLAADVDGAARADGNVATFGVFVVGTDGKVIGAQGAPGIGVNYNDAPAARDQEGLTVRKGRPPEGPGEIALDSATADKAGYDVGDEVPLVSSGEQPTMRAELVGIADFAGGSLAGASLTIFETKEAQDLFQQGKDAYTDIWVTAQDGVTQTELRDNVRAVLPAGVEAVTGDQAADEVASDVTEALGFITTFLLVFAAVALFVGSFIIVNTFSILVAQRSRELALFRALGASRRQVTRSVLFEALAIGLVGSTLGLALGFGLAQGLKAIFATFGLDLSGSALVFEWRTAIVAYAVGLIVTTVAAYLPSRRASRIPPVAALRDDVALPESSIHRRMVVGLTMVALGSVGMGVGLFTDVDRAAWYVGGGVLLVMLGVSLTSPVIGRPVVSVIGLLYRWLFGPVGRLAEQNAVRNPRRTAATASALMIGLALVSTMAVIGQSAKASVDEAVAKNLTADYVVSNAITVPFSPRVADQVADVPGVQTVSRFRYAPAEVDGERAAVGASDVSMFTEALDVDIPQGDIGDLRGDALFVEADRAKDKGWSVGDTVGIELPAGAKEYEIAGTFEASPGIATAYVMSLEALEAGGVAAQDNFAYVVREPGADRVAVREDIEKVIADLPTVTLKDQAEFAEEQRAPVDQLLTLIYALLGLAIIIAVLGIVNTLALSVIERTREVGLLRAVGVSRRQLRTMVRLESIAIALLGATLGVVLGVVFGVVLMESLADEGLTAVR